MVGGAARDLPPSKRAAASFGRAPECVYIRKQGPYRGGGERERIIEGGAC